MRRGIALIELIFAIVVIAFTLTAVPNLLSMSNNAAKSAITQESVSNGASNIAMIMSAYWDEQSTTNNYSNYMLNTNGGIWNLNQMQQLTPGIPGVPPSILTHIRPGSYLTTSRRFAPNDLNATLPANLGLDANDGNITKDDIDDYNGVSYSLIQRQATNASTGDYKDTNVTISTTVSYMNDSATYGNNIITDFSPFNPPIDTTKSTNIKMITTTITSPNNPNKKIILKAFSCNIGGVTYKERIFP